jgi:hypothetical protein
LSWGEKTPDEDIHPNIRVPGIAALRFDTVVDVSVAFRVRRAANAGRSAVFTRTAALRRQPGIAGAKSLRRRLQMLGDLAQVLAHLAPLPHPAQDQSN